MDNKNNTLGSTRAGGRDEIFEAMESQNLLDGREEQSGWRQRQL